MIDSASMKFKISWLTISLFSFILVLASNIFFQQYLFMQPCVNCVYIRLAFLIVAFGGIFGFLFGKFGQIFAYFMGFFGAIYGIYSAYILKIVQDNLKLDQISQISCENMPNFPFGIKFDEILPALFFPTGECGIDGPIVPFGEKLADIQGYFIALYADGWYLVPCYKFITMAEATIFIFVIFILIMGFMLLKNFKK